MKPPYDITNKILKLVQQVSVKLGEINAAHLHKPSLELRKRNRIKTVQASLEIEGNTLTEEQITALLENKRILGPKKDIDEVINALKVYDAIHTYKPSSLNSFLSAHKTLMEGLIKDAGKLRTQGVGIIKGSKVLAPPASNLKFLVEDLFDYLENDDDLVLIKSCVAHYELEFIHPFMDGNGRMGRLWQTVILMSKYPVFEYLPFETMVKKRQAEYYAVLSACDKTGKSTRFIEFMLEVLDDTLADLLQSQNRTMNQAERLAYFIAMTSQKEFKRKDYLNLFKDISSATASRDLKAGVNQKLFAKKGDKRTAIYQILV
ncbi:MAG: Fic family protein [Flammeovirgaceae bacterium]